MRVWYAFNVIICIFFLSRLNFDHIGIRFTYWKSSRSIWLQETYGRLKGKLLGWISVSSPFRNYYLNSITITKYFNWTIQTFSTKAHTGSGRTEAYTTTIDSVFKKVITFTCIIYQVNFHMYCSASNNNSRIFLVTKDTATAAAVEIFTQYNLSHVIWQLIECRCIQVVT